MRSNKLVLLRGAALDKHYVRKSIIFVKGLMERIHIHDVSGMAAQLAFFFLLSLFPLLIFLVTLVPYLPITENDIIYYINNFTPENAKDIISIQLDQIMKGSSTLLSVGVIGTLWTASNALNGITKAFNKAYDLEEERKFFIMRTISMLLTIAMIFVFIGALLIPVFGKQIGIFVSSYLGYDDAFLKVWDTIRWLLSIVVLFIMFLILYRVFPNKKLKQRSILKGAIFSTIGWSVASYGFSYYVNHFSHYSATYGSLGGIIVLMLWFYILAHVIIIGGEINAMYSKK